MEAKEVVFNPSIRVLVPTGGCNGYTEEEYAKRVAKTTLMEWTKEELLEWIFDFEDDEVLNSSQTFDPEYDN